MTDTGYSRFKMNGVSLTTYAWNIEDVSGIDGMPGRRGRNLPTPYVDGDYSFGVKFYESRSFILKMVVLPNDAAGNVTSVDGARWHLRDNFDTLKGVLNQNAGMQTFSFEVKDGVGGGSAVREIDVEILAPFGIREKAKQAIEFSVELVAPRPLWRELPLVTVDELAVSTFPYNFNVDTLANAPIGDMVITLDANAAGSSPSLECVVTGDKITIADAGIVLNDQFIINLNTRSFTKNTVRADPFIQRETAWFMRLPPAASLAMRLDALSGDYDLKLEYHKKWL